MRSIVLLCAVWAMSSLAGCSDSGPKRFGVTGKVDFDGKPVSTGTIRFEPAGKEIFSAEGLIADGNYSIAAERGLTTGDYQVYISSADPKQMVKPEEAPGGGGIRPMAKDIIPKKYNLKTTLKGSVKDSPSNVLDYSLSK